MSSFRSILLRSVAALTLALFIVLLQPSSLAAQPPRDPEKIEAAIKKGIEFLKQSDLPIKQRGGAAEPGRGEDDVAAACLAGIALMECGVPKVDESVQHVYRRCKAGVQDLQKTRTLSYAIWFLTRYGNPTDKPFVKMLCLRLLAGQTVAGRWGDECMTLTRNQERELEQWLRERENSAAMDQEDEGNPLAPREVTAGNQNIQFAALALWLGRKSGAPVRHVLLRTEKHLEVMQFADGGWGWGDGRDIAGASNVTMTCAGLFTLGPGQSHVKS